jgi:hypothetical protein
MGGLVIETVRPGVQFTPEAANAFRRAEAQVRAEFGRNIDVNSTYRSWAVQYVLYIEWQRYVASGYNPAMKPNHSKAVHPSESFHVSGLALDSDDWVNARIVEILADNGFIRNRLSVPNEKHHFEYIRSRDKNYGRPAGGGGSANPQPAIGELMYIKAKSDGDWARKGVIYSNDIGGHWRGLTNLEGNGYVLPLVAQGKLPYAEFNGTDMDLLFAVNGVWEQLELDPKTSPYWGDTPGVRLMGLGALTGRLRFPGQPEGWHYPKTQATA